MSSLIALWSEKELDTISIFLNLPRLDFWPKIWSILENVPWAFEKKVYSVVFGWNVLEISIKSILFNVSFKACVSLFIFILGDLSIGESQVLKSPTMIVLLSISPFMAVSICLIYWGFLCWVHKYLQLLYLLLGLIPWSLCGVLLCLL